MFLLKDTQLQEIEAFPGVELNMAVFITYKENRSEQIKLENIYLH